MGITIIDTAINSQPTKLNTSYPNNKAGFQDQLNEAMKASDRKSASKDRAVQAPGHYQLHDSAKQNVINLGIDRLSSGMVNLYLAQERKDVKSGKGRAVAHV